MATRTRQKATMTARVASCRFRGVLQIYAGKYREVWRLIRRLNKLGLSLVATDELAVAQQAVPLLAAAQALEQTLLTTPLAGADRLDAVASKLRELGGRGALSRADRLVAEADRIREVLRPLLPADRREAFLGSVAS